MASTLPILLGLPPLIWVIQCEKWTWRGRAGAHRVKLKQRWTQQRGKLLNLAQQ